MKVFWTKFALNSLEAVHKYYKDNVSVLIANNIKNTILTSVSQLEKFPLSGSIEELLKEMEQEHRYIIRGNYKIIYRINNESVFITDVFDSRQNPDNLILRNI